MNYYHRGTSIKHALNQQSMRIGHFASEGSTEFATLANRFKSIKNFIKLTHCRLLNRLLLFRDLVCQRPAKMAPSINHYHLQVFFVFLQFGLYEN